MILGIGTDMVDIRRIERMTERFGDRFLHKIFTQEELALARSRPAQSIPTLARRFAAREACLKALGTGMRQGYQWHDIAVLRNAEGKPEMKLSGMAARKLAALAEGRAATAHLSLSDEYPYAFAFVVLEAL